jgi:hypothetical protein
MVHAALRELRPAKSNPRSCSQATQPSSRQRQLSIRQIGLISLNKVGATVSTPITGCRQTWARAGPSHRAAAVRAMREAGTRRSQGLHGINNSCLNSIAADCRPKSTRRPSQQRSSSKGEGVSSSAFFIWINVGRSPAHHGFAGTACISSSGRSPMVSLPEMSLLVQIDVSKAAFEI